MSSGADRVVVGIGNGLGGDDAAGLLVARRVRERAGGGVHELEGDPSGLVELLAGARMAVVVDAVRSGAPAGTVHRFDVGRDPLPAPMRTPASTHALSVADAVELARALGRLPARVVVYGIEGGRFDAGAPPSPAVAEAVEAVAAAVLGER